MSKKFFLDWETEVKRQVPADGLLVHSAKDGWEPLCKFLEVPTPEHDYPRVNDTKTIQNDVRNLKLISALVIYGLPLLLVISIPIIVVMVILY